MDAELNFDLEPRTQGRAKRRLEVDFVRELGESDIALLQADRGVKAPTIKRLTERHHYLARLLVLGNTPGQCTLLTGLSPSRISILQGDPTFRELMEAYRGIPNAAVADFVERATQVAVDVVDRLAERLEDEPDMPTSTLLEVGKFVADRTGHAPQTKAVNVNIHSGMAARMEAGRQRVLEMRKVIDAEFTEVKPDE